MGRSLVAVQLVKARHATKDSVSIHSGSLLQTVSGLKHLVWLWTIELIQPHVTAKRRDFRGTSNVLNPIHWVVVLPVNLELS